MTVSAKTPNFDLDMGKEYLYFCRDDDLENAAKITGEDRRDIEKLFDENNLVMLDLSEDNRHQIRVAHYKNELSEKIRNLDSLPVKELAEFEDKLTDSLALGSEVVEATYIQNTDAPIKNYIVRSEFFTDNGGDYVVTQYVTVVDGAFWHITSYGPNHSNVPSIIPHFSVGKSDFELSKVFYLIGSLFAAFAVVVFVLYLRERRSEKIKEGSDENEENDS